MKTFITKIITSIFLGAIFIYLFAYAPPVATALSAFSILIYIILFEWPKLFNYKKYPFWLILPFYLILPFALTIYMCLSYNYRILLFFMVILTSLQDTGGYIFGSLFGKHKLAPSISPKKSWEGFFGGYLCIILGIIIISYIQNVHIHIWFILLFSLAISVLATIGDLFESFLKRSAGIKDTGTILPGHGGFLDRIDSYLATIFIFFFFKDYLVKIFNI